MARAFDGTTEYLSHASQLGLTAYPFTFACWFARGANGGTLMSLARSDANDWVYGVQITATGEVRITANNGVDSEGTDTSSNVGAGTFAHAAAVFSSAGARTAYLNGGSASPAAAVSVTKVNTGTPAFGVGAAIASPVGGFFDGAVAEAAVWNAALAEADLLQLAKGFSPLVVRPAALVAYWPLIGNASPEPDRWNTRWDLTLAGAPGKTAHPRIYHVGGV